MLNVFVICSDPTPGDRQRTELWRAEFNRLEVNIININRQNQCIPSLDLNENSNKSVLVITGEHGDVDSEIYNEVHLSKWKQWVKKQISHQFDLIVVDLCDSSYLIEAANFQKLLTTDGVIVSYVSTCHGIRQSLLETRFESIPLLLRALKENIEHTTEVLGGSNMSFVKKKSVSSFCTFFYSESTRLICDNNIPMSLDEDSEIACRNKVLDKLDKINIQKHNHLSSYVDGEEIMGVLKQDKINWPKVGLFGTVALVGIGLVCSSNGASLSL